MPARAGRNEALVSAHSPPPATVSFIDVRERDAHPRPEVRHAEAQRRHSLRLRYPFLALSTLLASPSVTRATGALLSWGWVGPQWSQLTEVRG